MTDLQLMGLAAKAAGLEYGVIQYSPRIKVEYGWTPWNPLTDDGDALRLAVKLRLSIEHHNDVSQPDPWLRIEDRAGMWTHTGPSLEFNEDPYAATRRAIVRAAAAMAS